MTAIAGLWRFDGRPDAAEGCRRMLAAQKIYGPHLGGQWADGSVALSRLMILASS
jgi:asparagine synthase (glutamine-hydrolysing)